VRSRKAIATQIVLLGAALVLFWMAVRNVPISEVATILRGLSLRALLLLAALNTGVWLIVASRWWLILLGFDYRLPFWRVFRYRLTVHGVSYLTPGPQVGGEVLQIYYPTENHGVPAAVALAATSVDKSLELLGNFTLLAIGLLFAITGHEFLSEADLFGLLLLLGFLLVPVGLIGAIWRGFHPFSALLTTMDRRLSPAQREQLRRLPLLRRFPSLHRFQQTTRHTEELIHWLAHHRPWVFVAAIAVSLLALVLITVEFWVMNRFLEIPIGFSSAISVLMLVYFAFLLPMPAGLGAMEAALVTGYTAIGLSSAQALSQALLMRARDLIFAMTGLALGGIGFFGRRALPHPTAPQDVPTPEELPPSPASLMPYARAEVPPPASGNASPTPPSEVSLPSEVSPPSETSSPRED